MTGSIRLLLPRERSEQVFGYRGGVQLAFQGTLLGGDDPAIDDRFAGAVRSELAGGAWIEHVPGWLRGADSLFDVVVDRVAWHSEMVRMWEKKGQPPGLPGSLPAAARPPIVDEMRSTLS